MWRGWDAFSEQKEGREKGEEAGKNKTQKQISNDPVPLGLGICAGERWGVSPEKVVEARWAASIEYQSKVPGFYFADKVKPLKAMNNPMKAVIWEVESGSTMKKEFD